MRPSNELGAAINNRRTAISTIALSGCCIAVSAQENHVTLSARWKISNDEISSHRTPQANKLDLTPGALRRVVNTQRVFFRPLRIQG
jgi:hypothetical protein